MPPFSRFPGSDFGARLCLVGSALLVCLSSSAVLAHPTITLFSPAEDDVFQAGEPITVTIEAQSGHENVDIKSVSVVVDGAEVGTRQTTPYVFELLLEGGEHKVKATGLDTEDSPGESDLVYIKVEGELQDSGAEVISGHEDIEDDDGTTEEGGGGEEMMGEDMADDKAETGDSGGEEGCSMGSSAQPLAPALAMLLGFAGFARSRRGA